MILTFSRKTLWNTESNFKQSIKAGIKIHTFRRSNQMKVGHRIDFWDEAPHQIAKEPKEFFLENYDLASRWTQIEDSEGKIIEKPLCYATEPFRIVFPQLQRNRPLKNIPKNLQAEFKLGDLFINEDVLEMIAINDGFKNSRDFLTWFFLTAIKLKDYHVAGEVKHWTDQVYDAERATIIQL